MITIICIVSGGMKGVRNVIIHWWEERMYNRWLGIHLSGPLFIRNNPDNALIPLRISLQTT